MGSEWGTRPLKNCGKWLSVGTPSKSRADYWDGHIPWISAKSLKSFFVTDSDERLTEAGLEKGGRLVPKGTILFVVRGMSLADEFRIGITKAEITFNQYLKAVIPSEGIDSRFLFYAIRSVTPTIMGMVDEASHGTRRLQTQRLEELPIPIPTLPEQQTIASILGCLDDKIDLNRRMNQTLESIAQSIFKSWFVDFDPVRAKAAGQEPVGMDAETAALFPDGFEESDLGEIPRGWRVVPIQSVVEKVFDGPHATPKAAEDGPVFLGIKNFTGTSLDLRETKRIGWHDWPKWTKRVTPQTGDIVFTYEATLGFFALIPPELQCCLGRRVALIRPKAELRNSHFLLHSFIAPPFQDLLRAHVNPGSTVDRILLKDFPGYPILYPDQALVEQYQQIAVPIWSKLHTNQKQSATLASIRDTLLPKLLSGELRVPDAEKIVAEVA